MFLNNWNDYLHKCSVGILQMLKEKFDILVNINIQVIDLFKQIESRASHPTYENFDNILTNRVATFEKETLECNIHKLQRDRFDQRNNHAQFWKAKTHVTNQPSNTKITQNFQFLLNLKVPD